MRIYPTFACDGARRLGTRAPARAVTAWDGVWVWPSLRQSGVAASDETQALFLRLVGSGRTQLQQMIKRNFADIRALAPGFRAYTAPGTVHIILRRAEFHSTRVSGVRLRDWVAGLANGQAVTDATPMAGN